MGKTLGRDHLIDMLRTLAACSIVLFHLNEPVKYIDNWYRNTCKLMWLGVPVFFVISGYCIFIAVQHSRSANEFMIRRFFRIFPNYWFSLIVVLLCIALSFLFHGINGLTPLPKNILDIAATITLLTSPFSEVHTINWVYWSLTYELFFYVVTYGILFMYEKIRLPAMILVTVFSIFIKIPPNGILFFLQYWPAFALGLSVYCILHYKKEKLILGALLSAVSILGIVNNVKMWEYTFVCAATAALITLNHFYPIKANFISRLGDYSYSIYLFHVPIGIYILGMVNKYYVPQTSIFFNIVSNLFTLAVIVIVSKYIFNFVEKPMMDLGRKITRGYKS